MLSPVRPPSLSPSSTEGAGHEHQDAQEEKEVDFGEALLDDPIVGVETVSPAHQAKPLPTPKAMSAAQKAIHDLTHLPYDPGCEICVSTRRPNSHHQSVKSSERDVPLLVGDYCFP